MSEHSVAGVESSMSARARGPGHWLGNLPEILIGGVILTAGTTLVWLSWEPHDAAKPGTPPTAEASKAQPSRAESLPKLTPHATARHSSDPPSPMAVPWLDPSAASSADCASLAKERSTRSVPRRAQAEKRGLEMLLRGNLVAARDAFCEATRNDAPSPLALSGLVRTQLQLDDPESALSTAERLVKVEHDSADAENLMGDVLIRLGRVDDARARWTRATGAPRLSRWLEARLRSVSLEQADEAIAAAAYPRADRMLRRVIAFEPKDVEAAAKLASVLRKAKKDEAAARWLSYAESLNPQHPYVRQLREKFPAAE